MTAEMARRRFSVDEYSAMARAGILGEDDRVELIEGEIIDMSPIGRRHAACVARLSRLFERNVGERAIVWSQNPIRLSEQTEPQPDIALLRPRSDFYAAQYPTPPDILLIVEVAETSSRVDRLVKMPLYGASGVREYWIVDLEEETVTVFCDPHPTGYGSVRTLRRGERLAPLALPEAEVGVEDVLP
jgi:Uma2 family endonuclease